MEKALKSVTEVVKKVSPGYLNQVSVLSDRIDRMYSNENRHFRIAVSLSIVALLLTCLGQYSLSLAVTIVQIMKIAVLFLSQYVSRVSVYRPSGDNEYCSGDKQGDHKQ